MWFYATTRIAKSGVTLSDPSQYMAVKATQSGRAVSLSNCVDEPQQLRAERVQGAPDLQHTRKVVMTG
jgi:hypothetical protein